MPRFSAVFLSLCVFLLTVAAIATNSTPESLGTVDFAHSEANLDVSRTSTYQTSIALQNPNIISQEMVADYHSYQFFGIPGEPTIADEGSPSVPHVTRFYRIPETGGVDLVVTNADYDLVENVDPFPYQPEDGNQFSGLRKNSALYAKNEWYPSNVAEISEPMIMRDFRVVTVTLYPVQVNPVTHQARIYRNLSADVVANGQPGVNELLNPRRPSRDWAEIYRSSISNLDDNALDDMTTTPGSLLIVTSTNNIPRPWADSLFVWKTRQGFRTVVDARSNWNASSVTSAIRTAYTTWDPPLEYVILLGDPGESWAIPADGSMYDHSYALGNTGDDIEDISVGRLSGGSADKMAVINAKIMAYERTPHMTTSGGVADTSWFNRAYLYAGTARGCAGNYQLMQWAQRQFTLNTGVDSATVGHHDVDQVNAQDVRSHINAGTAFFLWRGSWIGGMGSDIADPTNPGGRYPITMTITCMAGEYASSGVNSPAEDFLVAGTAANPGGGVCGMGTSTAGTQNGANVILAAGVIYDIADLKVEHIGTAVNHAKMQLYRSYAPNQPDPEGGLIAPNFTRYFNLLGDPSLSIYTDVPTVLTVTHPTILNVGSRSVSVTVHRSSDDAPVENAIVTLWKRGSDSTYVKGTTDALGQLILPVSVNLAGDMYLTVTKQQCKPYLFTIPCVAADWMPMLSTYTIDDDNSGGTQGNNDGIANAGETVDLPIYIRNFGTTTTVNNVRAVMSCSNPRITVVTDSVSYPAIAPGDSAIGAVAFRVHLAADMQNAEVANLNLHIITSAGETFGSLPLRCAAGEVRFNNYRFLTGSFGPGITGNLSVTVQNHSTVPMTAVTGHLTSLSPFVQVDNPNASFGDIPAGSLDSNSTSPFTLTANSLAFAGHQAPMLLVLTTAGGFADSVRFIVPVGTAQPVDPTGPDAFGYYAYDNSDLGYDLHPSFSYVDISTTGSNLNLSDPGDKTNWNVTYSAARQLPFSFKFYGRVYDSITVCSNGWCAFGNQSNLDLFRNYQIPAMGAPDALIAPYWDDLQTTGGNHGVYVKADTANHRYIIQWKATTNRNSQLLDFEVILLDTTYYPTFDGNGQVLVQYNHVFMNVDNQYGDEAPGCTVGIQAPGSTIGLQYAYQANYTPGSATVSDGRAILFSTEAHMMFGSVEGVVTDVASHQPMIGANITVDGYAYHTQTDNLGHYILRNVLIGTYDIRATAHRYNSQAVTGIVISLNDTSSANFELAHPMMALSTPAIHDTIGGSPAQFSFNINNSGNGPLDYEIQVFYGGDENPNPWDSVGGINLSASSNDYLIMGCEFAYDQWWVTGGNGPSGQNRIYRYDIHGNEVGSIPQPTNSSMGWFDLAFDGQYLWGSDSHSIYAIDTTGQLRDSIPSPLNPSRAIAYDPSLDHFWVADYRQDIYELDRDGNIFRRIANSGSNGLSITGLAWNPTDPNGFSLYAFSQDGENSATRVTRFNPNGRSETVVDLPTAPGVRSGGCTITPSWNSVLLVFGAILQDPSGDRLAMYEMAFNTTWIGVSPMQSTVQGGNNGQVTLSFDPSSLRDATYRVNLHISSVVYDTTMILPVALTVQRMPESAGNPGTTEVPKTYALYQNYPNPFNPETQIRFDLPAASRVKLAIYNSIGQKVATLVDDVRPAGSHVVRWNGQSDNGLPVATGLYFYRIEAGSMTDVKKMLLMH